MKAVLEFDIDDPSDNKAHRRAIAATDAFLALHDIDNILRQHEKYGTGITEGTKWALPEGYHTLTEIESTILHEFIRSIRIKIGGIMNDNGINMDYLE
jgi:hypothetical protein